MKKLVAIAALGLILSFSTISIASDYMGFYTNPIITNEVNNITKNGKIERDHMSLYSTPKGTDETTSALGRNTTEDGNSHIVVGVRATIDKKLVSLTKLLTSHEQFG